MESLIRDVRFGLRGLLKRPGLTVVAILSLGLGIGANATVFTWLNGFVFQPLPAVPGFHRLVEVTTRAPGGGDWSLSYLSLRDWRAQSRSLELTGVDMMQLGLRGDDGEIVRTWAGMVGGNYFDMLRVRPALGRLLTLRDEEERAPVVVLGYSFWQSRFGGDSAVIGRPLVLNGQQLTVVGVAASRFGGTMIGLRWDMFMPVTARALLVGGTSLTDRDWQFLDGVARLRDGYTMEQAAAELDGIAKSVSQQVGDNGTRNGAKVKPYSEVGAAGFLKPVLLSLLGITAVVLLIACANVANLLLARAIGRRREIGIRLALGANRRRLIRQLFTESLVLGLLAGALGVTVAFWGRDLMLVFVPPAPFPIGLDLKVSGTVLLFTVLLTIGASVAFGLAPAVHASSPELVPTLKDEIGGAPRSRSRLQSFLVVAQVSLSIVSLVCAGLFARSLSAARNADVGFTGAERTLLISTDLQLAGVPDSSRVSTAAALLDGLRAVPGVEAASLIMRAPLGFGGQSSMSVNVEGYVAGRDENISVEYQAVGSDYFRAQGVPMVRGRGITTEDVATSQAVAVVNEQFANRFWPGQDAVGKRFSQGGAWRTVVGVARQGVYHSLTEAPVAVTYLPHSQFAARSFDVLVRTPGDPMPLTPALRRVFQNVNADVPFLDVRTMAGHMQAAVFVQEMGATMLAAFGGIALALSAIGIYGVMSYTVSQRTREIGVRVALGAARRDVVALVVGRAMKLVAIGLVVGLAAAVGAGRLLRSQLVGVSPYDPLTFTGIALLLAAVAFAASAIPARRASRVDPLVALRSE